MSNICKQCRGSGYDNFSGEDCHACKGRGTVNFWETRQYQETGKAPKGYKADVERGYITIGLIGGAVVGIGAYVVTLDLGIAISAMMITTLLAATLLRLFFKYLLAIFIIGYLLYLVFG